MTLPKRTTVRRRRSRLCSSCHQEIHAFKARRGLKRDHDHDLCKHCWGDACRQGHSKARALGIPVSHD